MSAHSPMARQSSTTHPATTVITKQSTYALSLPTPTSPLTLVRSLAIARIFGGFPESFFSTYHSYFPKTKPVEEYEERMELYKLFHYLNHTLVFGVSEPSLCSLSSFLLVCVRTGWWV